MREARQAMKYSILPAVAAVAILSLAACENKVETVDTTSPDPLASQVAKMGPVELPPAIIASATLRCSDNSLVYVDFFQGDKKATLRTEANGAPHPLNAENAGDPFTGDGYTLTGNKDAATIEMPGKGMLRCHV